MRRRYTGGCHCGAVRFEADIDLAEGTFKCNCSMCAMTRLWAPLRTENFRLLSGEDDLVDYQPNTVHHVFCRRCGGRSFGWGEDPAQGGVFHVARIACLDDVDVDELVRAPVTYFDGAHDDYKHPPAEIRHL